MIEKTILQNGYVPQRQGNVLHLERQEDMPTDLSGFSVIKFKRGMEFVFDFALRPSTDYMAFGDPTAPRPIVRKSNAGQISENNRIHNTVFADLDIRGGRRGLSFFSCNNILITRCNFSDNTPDALSNGIYAKAVNNIKVTNCTSSRLNGDVFYGVAVKNAELAWNDFDFVNGGGADNIQFSHEGKASGISDGIVITNNILRSSPLSTSGKGAIAVEGVINCTISDNDVEGRYFGITANGTNVLVQRNKVYETDKTNPFSWGIGVSQDSENVLIKDNIVKNSSRGFLISASNPSAINRRVNINFENNKVKNCTTGLFIDVPYTGTQINNDFGRRASDIVIR